MTALVVLANPRARHLRRNPDLVSGVRARLGSAGVLFVPDGLDALDRDAAHIATLAPAVIALLGGDGTCGRTLDALTRAFPEGAMPPVALLGGGTMNTIARSLGVRGHPLNVLDRVLESLATGAALPRVRRSMLEVDGRRGFLFGNGLFARYIEAYEARGAPGPARAAWVLAHAVGSALIGGRFARDLTRPLPARIELDGESILDGRILVAAAGTIDDVGLGFRPFVEAVRNPGTLSTITIACSPFALAFQLHHTWRGRPMRHPDVVERQGRVLRIHSDQPRPYMLDGDLGCSGPVTCVAVGPTLDLLVARAPRRLPRARRRLAVPVSRQDPAKLDVGA